MKAVTEQTECKEIDAGKNYEKAAADAIIKVKQDSATKVTEQRLRQELEKQQKDYASLWDGTEAEVSNTFKVRINCNSLKM